MAGERAAPPLKPGPPPGFFLPGRAAIAAAPQLTHAGAGRWTLFVRAGTSREIVSIQREKRFIALVDEDAEKTTLTFDRFSDSPAPDGKSIATFPTPTVILDADDFTRANRPIANTGGCP